MKLPARYPPSLIIISVVFYAFAIAISWGLGWDEVHHYYYILL